MRSALRRPGVPRSSQYGHFKLDRGIGEGRGRGCLYLQFVFADSLSERPSATQELPCLLKSFLVFIGYGRRWCWG